MRQLQRCCQLFFILNSFNLPYPNCFLCNFRDADVKYYADANIRHIININDTTQILPSIARHNPNNSPPLQRHCALNWPQQIAPMTRYCISLEAILFYFIIYHTVFSLSCFKCISKYTRRISQHKYDVYRFEKNLSIDWKNASYVFNNKNR